MHREENVDGEHRDHLLREGHLLVDLDCQNRLRLTLHSHSHIRDVSQHHVHLLLVLDSAVLRGAVHVQQVEFRRSVQREWRPIPLVGEHSDLVRLLLVDEALDHVGDDRDDNLDLLLNSKNTPCFAHTTDPAFLYSSSSKNRGILSTPFRSLLNESSKRSR